MGFEPTRAEHIGLAVQRLNHSATSSHSIEKALRWCVIVLCFWQTSVGVLAGGLESLKKVIPTPGIEPGPPG